MRLKVIRRHHSISKIQLMECKNLTQIDMNFYCVDNLAEYIKGLHIQNDEGL